MSKCNSDLKYLVNCKNISQRIKLNPTLEFMTRSSRTINNNKGNSTTVYSSVIKGQPMFEKTVSTLKADTESVEVRGVRTVCGPARCTAIRLARHTGQTAIPIRSFFFFTVFRPVSRRTSSSSDSSISSSAEKRISDSESSWDRARL